MRLVSILLSVVLISCLSIPSYAIYPGDIAEPSIKAPNMDMPEPLITKPNMNIPEPKTKPLAEPGSYRPSLNQNGNISSNQTQAPMIQQGVKPMDVSGKWSIKFDNRPDRSLDLTLWSSAGTRIMGFGTLIEEGAEKSMTVSGSVSEQELSLIAKSAVPEYANQKYDEYDLDLFMENNTLSGTYILKSEGRSLDQGNATAVKL